MQQQVLVLIPVKPSLNPELMAKAFAKAQLMVQACPDLELTICFDARKVEKLDTDSTPWSRVTRARNRLLDLFGLWPMGALIPRHFQLSHDWILWIDADVVDYPADLAQWLVYGAMNYAQNGVCAPTVLIEQTEPPIFYDTSAFIRRGRSHVRPDSREYMPERSVSGHPPYYWPGEEIIIPPDYVEMDVVGTCYVVHKDIYLAGARHWDHPAFTDHQPICAKAWEMGRKVVALPNVTAWHANLPNYAGESFH